MMQQASGRHEWPDAGVKVLVMLPTYNEIENIRPMAEAVLAIETAPETGEIGVRSFELLIVDDNSPDGTGEIADGVAREHPGKVHVIHRKERGRGTAGIAGFRFALTLDVDCLIEMDADFSHDPNDIPRFLKEIRDYDIVIGSRFARGGKTGSRSLFRKTVSMGAGFYARSVLGINVRDWHGGYKCYRTQALARLRFEEFYSEGYSIGMETLYRLITAGCTYKEIPITFKERMQGVSKFSTREIRDYLTVAWRLRSRATKPEPHQISKDHLRR